MQIRTKITLYFIVITASLLLFSFLVIYFISVKERQKDFQTQLKNKAITTADLLLKVSEVDSLLLKVIDKNRKDLLYFENISIYDFQNKEVYTNNEEIHFQNFFSNLDSIINIVRIKKEYKTLIRSATIVGQMYSYKNEKYVLLAGAKDLKGEKTLSQLANNLSYIYICVLSFLGITGWMFAKQVLKPISNVMNQVDLLSFKNLKSRLKVENKKDEIARLTLTFNKMLDRVERTFQLQNSFISNASHEIINPLTSITSEIEVTLLSKRNQDEYIKTLETILQEIRKLNEISEQLINLSKHNESQDRTSFQRIRIDDVLWEAKQDFLQKHTDSKIHFSVGNLPENDFLLFYNANETLLKTCFTNLIDNGVKFSTNKEIKIDLSYSVESDVIITFENDGVGISESEYENLFIPFYRSKKNSSNIKGYGIGLSIVKSILDIHHCEINVSSIPNQKTIFTIVFKTSKKTS